MKQNTKLLKREEVKKEFKWAIEDLYINDNEWQKEYEKLISLLKDVEEYKGRLAKDSQVLLQFLRLKDEIYKLFERVYVYANQKYHEDTSNSIYQDLSNKANNLYIQVNSSLSFFTPEILAIPEEELKDFIYKNNELKEYSFLLLDIFRNKPHILDKGLEKILSDVGIIADGASNIFSMFDNADIKFPDIIDDKGNKIPVTHGRFTALLEDKNVKIRKAAFESVYSVYESFKNTLAATYSANVKQESFYAKTRNFSSTLDKALFSSNIPAHVYKNLIEAVEENMDLMHRYVDIRKKFLKLEELHMYDLYLPLIEDVESDITYEEAKKQVIEGLKPLGSDYNAILKQGFSEGWIDVYENENKRSGAYSWGAYGTHPYVLLNYNNRLSDVFTLAHEMGHAIHSYYSDEKQPYVYAAYKTFVAEVASTCNEALLINYMLDKAKSKKEKAYLINQFLEKFKGTLYRQTMFAEFEMISHKMHEDGESLTADVLCELYINLNKKYFGDNIIIDKEIAFEWARIPHFYTSFYVYQYATGFSAAIAISRRILKEGDKAVKDYIEFLSSGGSNHPIELLKIAGVDMSKKEPINEALSLFKELLDQMEELA